MYKSLVAALSLIPLYGCVVQETTPVAHPNIRAHKQTVVDVASNQSEVKVITPEELDIAVCRGSYDKRVENRAKECEDQKKLHDNCYGTLDFEYGYVPQFNGEPWDDTGIYDDEGYPLESVSHTGSVCVDGVYGYKGSHENPDISKLITYHDPHGNIIKQTTVKKDKFVCSIPEVAPCDGKEPTITDTKPETTTGTQTLSFDSFVEFQQSLIDHGYDLGSSGADGVFGEQTQEAWHQCFVDKLCTIDAPTQITNLVWVK